MKLFELVVGGDYAAIEAASWPEEELNARNEDGMTALMYAAGTGDYRVIEALKNAGADLDICDQDGRKAVHHAAKNGHGNALIYLIEGGCGG